MNRLPDFQEEKILWKKGFDLVIGVDEVGRGAFAGPIVASAVAFSVCHPERSEGSLDSSAAPQNDIIIDDSKRLKPNQRRGAAKWIRENCLSFGIGEVGVGTINRIGIGKATERAMRRAVGSLLGKCGWEVRNELGGGIEDLGKIEPIPTTKTRPISHISSPFLLVDAFHIKYLRGVGLKNQKAIVKGDQKSISIAAASIIAKVYRDSLMQKLSKRYSQYLWGANKGYGTKVHQEAIVQFGLTKLHRTQFVQTFLSH